MRGFRLLGICRRAVRRLEDAVTFGFVLDSMNEESKSPSEWFTEEQRDKILRNVGASLIAIQAVEQLIDLGLLYVFREDPPTLAKIERVNAPEYRARTLG